MIYHSYILRHKHTCYKTEVTDITSLHFCNWSCMCACMCVSCLSYSSTHSVFPQPSANVSAGLASLLGELTHKVTTEVSGIFVVLPDRAVLVTRGHSYTKRCPEWFPFMVWLWNVPYRLTVLSMRSKVCGATLKAVEGLGGRVWLPEVDQKWGVFEGYTCPWFPLLSQVPDLPWCEQLLLFTLSPPLTEPLQPAIIAMMDWYLCNNEPK